MTKPTKPPTSGQHHFAPFVCSTIVFRDIDNIQLEVVAIDV